MNAAAEAAISAPLGPRFARSILIGSFLAFATLAPTQAQEPEDEGVDPAMSTDPSPGADPSTRAEPSTSVEPSATGQPAAKAQAVCGGVSNVDRVFGAIGRMFGTRTPSVLSLMRSGKYCQSNQAIGLDRDINNQRAHGYGLVSVPEFVEYANALLERLKAHVPLKDIPGSVHVTASQELLAGASADGNIYVSLGWIKTLQSEATLAALLAHELGHVALYHHESDIFSTIQRQFQTLAVTAVSLRRYVEGLQRDGTSKGVLTKGDVQQQEKLLLITKVTDRFALPAWNRRQELEADRFALDLMQRLGYGYAGSLKALLEHIADWEAEQNARRDERKAQVESLVLPDLRKQLGAELQRFVDEFARKHDDATARLTAIDTYYNDLYANAPRTAAATDGFAGIVKSDEVSRIIGGYDEAFQAGDLLARGQAREALAAAQFAAGDSGAVAQHAFPLLMLSKTLRQSGSPVPADRALARSFEAPEQAFVSYRELAYQLVRSGKRNEASTLMETAFKTFSAAPSVYPELIEFHMRHGQKERAQQLLGECVLQLPRIRELCQAAAKGA